MNVFEFESYKTALKHRVKELRLSGKTLSQQELAKRIPIQNTYLSKVLNDSETHINENDLFRACRILDFTREEIEYLLLLRAFQASQDPGYRGFLEDKISRIRNTNWRNSRAETFEAQASHAQMGYLLDPNCVLVHLGLMINKFQKDPRRLANQLGLSFDQMKVILQKLRDMDFISTTEDVWAVKEVRVTNPHFGPDHPLMRSHQLILRQKALVRIHELPESEKHIFIGTFTADHSTFQELKILLSDLAKRASQKIAEAPSQDIYQIGLELFRWF